MDNITHIEVADDRGHATIKTGQILQVVKETPCYIWVRGFDKVDYQISKKTKRINGTKSIFYRANKQPLMNI